MQDSGSQVEGPAPTPDGAVADQCTIDALTAVALASTPWDTFHALTRARQVLGGRADAYWPLLESITRRQTEIERLKRLAGSDAMTGVSNRRSFREALEREAARYRRLGDPFAVIMLDLDDLKHRNDRLGHAAGDRAIIRLAEVCCRAVRTTDLVARLGGDEFAVLLSGSDLAGARSFAERLRVSIEAIVVDDRRLRVSVGVAACGEENAQADSVVAAADLELYGDKATRKRRTSGDADEAA